MLGDTLHNFYSPDMSWSSSSAVASQIIAALIVGLLIAYGVQLMLTNLGVAIGLSLYRFGNTGLSSKSKSPLETPRLIPSMATLTGLGILLTIDGVLFAACFLAVRFAQVHDWFAGVVVGMVIWAAYFAILLWLSTAAISTLVSQLLGFTVTGVRGLLNLVRYGLGWNQVSLDRKTIAALRQQVQVVVDTSELQQTLEDYLAKLPLLSLETMRQDLKTWLEQSPDLRGSGSAQPFDVAMTKQRIKQRAQVSDAALQQAVNVLQEVWQEVIAQKVEQSTSDERNEPESKLEDEKSEPNEELQAQAKGKDFVTQNADQACPFSSRVETLSESPNQLISELYSQLESYLRYTNPKKLTPKRIERKLEKLLTIAKTQLASFELPAFDSTGLAAILSRRKGLSRKQRQQILQSIERIWTRTAVVANVVDVMTNQPPSAESISEPDPENSSTLPPDALIEKLAAYLESTLDLPNATDQLKQNLIHWLAQFQSEQLVKDLWHTLRQPMSEKTLTAGLEQWRQSLTQLWQEQLRRGEAVLLEGLPLSSLPSSTQTVLQSQIGWVKQQTQHYLETVQQTMQSQLQQWQQQVEHRLELARKMALVAAWWLFLITLTAALSSAAAGGLAAAG